ncbi:hypothetical protein VCHA50O407_40132 [Vibrio chagasii]|nr:hypothetical protein VCHA50P424_10131 [Vibrio chagasii]CAH7196232.1 hypothetical protein VCHA53O464_170087 [Vibrio chagasii]CAH7319012.1 hypothetical protein VCHA50O407_40132 [Vibrio chagasii]
MTYIFYISWTSSQSQTRQHYDLKTLKPKDNQDQSRYLSDNSKT